MKLFSNTVNTLEDYNQLSNSSNGVKTNTGNKNISPMTRFAEKLPHAVSEWQASPSPIDSDEVKEKIEFFETSFEDLKKVCKEQNDEYCDKIFNFWKTEMELAIRNSTNIKKHDKYGEYLTKLQRQYKIILAKKRKKSETKKRKKSEAKKSEAKKRKKSEAKKRKKSEAKKSEAKKRKKSGSKKRKKSKTKKKKTKQ